MIHPPNRSSANLHSNSKHPPLEEAGETLRPLLSSGFGPSYSKTSHREVLPVPFNRQQAGNFFSYKKFPNRARENSLADFPFKRRLNDKGLSSAAALAKDAVFRNCHLLKKVDENFYFLPGSQS